MGEQTCCVLCPIPGGKTSEAFDQVSQHTKSLVVAVGVWITEMFLRWHLGGSKDRRSNTTILVAHLSLSPAPCYPTVASLNCSLLSGCRCGPGTQWWGEQAGSIPLPLGFLAAPGTMCSTPSRKSACVICIHFSWKHPYPSLPSPAPSFSCLEAVIIPACLFASASLKSCF